MTIASSALATVDGADVVISMLPASRHVESLYLGAGGLLSAVATGTLIVDSSTISPEASRKVAEAASGQGLSVPRCAGLRRHRRARSPAR